MILWLAIRDGLYTQSFLLSFGVIREVKGKQLDIGSNPIREKEAMIYNMKNFSAADRVVKDFL